MLLSVFEKTELAAFTLSEWDAYEANLKIYRDWKGVFDTAISDGQKRGLERGREIGQEQERLKIAQALKVSGVALDIIHQTTGLSLEQIQQI